MFYAQRTPYGAGTASRADRLLRFASRAERDAWVRATGATPDNVDRAPRDTITREQARRWYPAAFGPGAGNFPPARATDDYWDDPEEHGGQEWLGAPTGGIYARI